MPETLEKTEKAMGRPVGSSKEASLARILPAARKLFAENGYSKTTFKEIGKEVGMTHAALYGYFPSKAALYQATCDHAQGLLLADYAEAIREKPTRVPSKTVQRKTAFLSHFSPIFCSFCAFCASEFTSCRDI